MKTSYSYLFTLILTLTLFLALPSSMTATPRQDDFTKLDQLNTLINKVHNTNLNNYPDFYAHQVSHALHKAEKVGLDVTSTDEQRYVARLELQVAYNNLTVDLQKATILELQELVKVGKLTYKELTQMCLDRIELYDLHTIRLNTVRTLYPDALADAEKCDVLFASNPEVAKGMFGIPILIKDNVNVVGMPTTAGSVALADNYAPYDATLITKLKASGAVILGKANLTEFANYIALNMPTGFSSLGGQVRNPYRPVQLLGDTLPLRPSGSSAGSGAGASAALAAVTIGTETSGSILSPCFANSIVGIKPTVGLISRWGIIPISSTQDTGGPMGRNVTDVAILLNMIAGYDPLDQATEGIHRAGVTDIDYTKSLKLNDLKGKRLGLLGVPAEGEVAYEPFNKALKALEDAGAEIVTKPDGTALTYYNAQNPNVNPRSPNTIILDYDFAKDLPAYLSTLDKNYPIKTLGDIIDFNNNYMMADSSAFPYGQALLIRCNDVDLEAKREEYIADRQKDILYSRDHGIDYLLTTYNLDGLVGIGTVGGPFSPTLIGAKAGYPTVSLPLANPGGTTYPLNITFTGTAFSEAQLIEFAYVVEQATHFRTPPGLADKSQLGAALDAAMELSQGLSTHRRALLSEKLDVAMAVYQSNFATQMDVDTAHDELCVVMDELSIPETVTERLKNHVYTLASDSLRGRRAGSEFARKAADYIALQWKEMGVAPLQEESYFRPFIDNMFHNVIGVIPGSHPVLKDEYIVVGAHYDHLGSTGQEGTTIYNGADDNASGTAVLIELGRMIKEIAPSLGRSVILVAFDAEELGLFGSYNFVNYPIVPLDKVKLMFSVDMVGWYQATNYVKYSGTGTMQNGEQFIVDPALIPDGLNVKTQRFERFLLGGTDTYGFAEKDIPTLHVTTGSKSPYHEPEDEAELIDYDGMALVTEHLRNIVQAISTDERFSSSGKISIKHKLPKFSLGISAHIGSNAHQYTSGALKGKSAGAYSLGLSAGINMGHFGFRPEVYYDFIQARHPQGKMATHGITVPLNLLLQVNSALSTGAALFAGPYYSYKFSGKQGSEPLDFDNLYRRNEFGLNWGVELHLSYIRIGATCRTAFTHFTRTANEEGAHIRNSVIFFTLGYTF